MQNGEGLRGESAALHQFMTDKMGFDDEELAAFQRSLAGSHAPSVDLFLENNRQFERLGKTTIAVNLIRREDPKAFERQAKPRWYELLFHRMIDGGNFEENTLSVITFNYDRSLETFLLLALCSLHGIKEAEAEKRLSRIPIIHMYGSLGTRIWKPVMESGRAYQPKLERAWIEDAINGIRIMHETRGTEEVKEAKVRLSAAEEVIFLGFGFHAINIERLGLREVIETREREQRRDDLWWSSRVGMGDGDVERARRVVEFVRDFKFGQRSSSIVGFFEETPCLLP